MKRLRMFPDVAFKQQLKPPVDGKLTLHQQSGASLPPRPPTPPPPPAPDAPPAQSCDSALFLLYFSF